ncbi:glycosyltransferase [Paraburkholderia azotifigens]|uniref:Glycosyltransferase family 4 protein n=1 Tax=Paraburkholderia azotifigens TaxID=2057004 RepID=A0A5C6VUZ7_9BURK|nr:glycosyltransferase [Paraburkholderia azotifigens]TXC88739.1 glycosyltransferase family 4 protein [Paraburkholderia azotifigens]
MTDKLLTEWSTASLGKSTTVDNKRTVFYVQPLIAHYRMEVIESLNRLFAVKLFASSAGIESNGFSREKPACAEFVETQISQVFSPGINMQREVVGRILRERPAAVLMFADIRYLSLWLALMAGRAMRIPVLIHGQGLCRHEEDVGLIRGLCYRVAVALSTQYICYTDASRRSLERVGCPSGKLIVADNSLTVEHTVDPADKTGKETGILFLGRLRDDSNVDALIEAVGRLRSEDRQVTLHLVGGGKHGAQLKRLYGDCDYVVWYGPVFDESRIAAISRQCRIGCYPGAAGLSVVHMFGLSLPPLVPDEMRRHMGPEPGYVEDGSTGFFYPREGGVDALADTLRRVWTVPPDTMRAAAAAAHSKYQQLNSPTLGRKLAEIVRASLKA